MVGRGAVEGVVTVEAELQQAVLDSLPSQMAVLDAHGTIIAVNAEWRDFAEHSGAPGCGEGDNFFDVCARATGDAEGDATLAAEGVRQVLAGMRHFTMDVSCDTPEGTRWFLQHVARLDADGGGAVLSYTDITARKELEEAAQHQATHDVLTGLPNRTLLRDRLQQALAIGRRTGGGVAVLFIDIDRFKAVNDEHGHAAGDAVLVEVARRLEACVRPTDTVGRFAGDEFIVICSPAGQGRALADEVAERIRQAMVAPVPLAGYPLQVRLSIGIHVADRWTRTPEEVLDLADAAMLAAKVGGRREAALVDAVTGVPADGDADRPRHDGEDSLSRSVQRLLHLLRRTVGMEVAWISEFVGSEQVFRYVDVAAGVEGPQPGTHLPLSGAYCARVLNGGMPARIPDTRANPDAALLPVTFDLHIGAYLGVPLHGRDGTPEGMLCATSRGSAPALSEEDVSSARLVADVIEDLHRRAAGDEDARTSRHALEATVRDLCRGQGRHVVAQPIHDLSTGDVLAAEALTRFDDDRRNTAQWFATANALGLGRDLEVAAAASALQEIAARPGHVVSINLSPDVVVAGALDELLADVDPAGVIVEVTEHAPVASYEALEGALAPHRERGLRVAIDDVGAGYASMQHCLRMHPDVIKIDMSLVRDVDRDPVRQSLIAALGSFGEELHATVVAEGVETEAEREELVRLGIGHGQGWLFGPAVAVR